jgi:hypothetical protein
MGRRASAVGVVLLLAGNALAAPGRKACVFSARFEPVWNAALETAREAYLLDKTSREQGYLRFRTGPLRRYRFDALVSDAGLGKTRVLVELRPRVYGLEKSAWHNGERFLGLVAAKLKQSGDCK